MIKPKTQQKRGRTSIPRSIIILNTMIVIFWLAYTMPFMTFWQHLPPKVVDVGAPVHGLVHKAGHLDLRMWHANYSSWRKDSFREWRDITKANPSHRTHPDPSSGLLFADAPPVNPGCQVFINHKYKFIYLRLAKTASTSLFDYFGACSSNEQNNRNSHLPTCMQELKIRDIEQAQQLWQDYFVFAFIRNPWKRALSSYRMLMRYMARETVKKYSWKDYCADPASIGLTCATDTECSQKTPGFTWLHILAQHHCLLTEDGGFAADFVGRVENTEEDLRDLVVEINKRRLPSEPELPLPNTLKNVNPRKCVQSVGLEDPAYKGPQELFCETADFFDENEYGPCIPQLAHYYKKDVDTFGFVH
jgi:hypothetical protein